MNKPKAVRVWVIDMHVALHQRKPKHGQAKPYMLVPSSLYRKMRRELRETKAKLEATLKGIGHANSQQYTLMDNANKKQIARHIAQAREREIKI